MSTLGNASNPLEARLPPFHSQATNMVTAEGTGGGGGLEQIPVDRNVRPRSSSSAAWEYFTQVTTGDGKRKGKCKKCKRVYAADTKTNGTSRLLRHAKKCYQLQMPRRPRAAADPVPVPPLSTAPSHPTEHGSNQLVVNPNSHAPSSFSNNLAIMLSSLSDDDHVVQSTMQPPQSYHQHSSPSASFFDGLPVPPAPAQPSNDPPPPVPQTVPCDPPAQPPLPCPPSSHPDEEEASNHLFTSHRDENGSNPSSLSNNLASFRPHDDDYDMQISQPDYQQSSPTPSYPTDLPPTPACDPSHLAPPQHCIDPPLSVPQTDPPPPLPSTSNDPLPTSMSCPPPSEFEEELPDREHGREENEEKAGNHLAQLIALHGFDPALVEDDCFRSFVAILNPEFKLPSRLVIEERCDAIFDEAREDLLSKLSRAPGKVSLSVATTKTVHHGEVLYTACHFIDDEWKLHKVVLDAYLVAPLPLLYGALCGLGEVSLNSDCFKWAIDAIVDGISQRGILDKLFMVSWEMGFKKEDADAEMRKYMSEKFSKDSDRNVIVIKLMDGSFHYIAERTQAPVDFTTEVLNAVGDLNLTRQEREQFFSRMGLDHLRHEKFWFSIYCSMKVLRKDGSTSSITADTVTEEIFYKFWDEVYHCIQRISAPTTSPTSNLCLIELLKLREVLQSELARTTGVVRKDVADALFTANFVLELLIEVACVVWAPPLVMDPRYKLTYIKFAFRRTFTSAKAAQSISKVTRRIKNLYAEYSYEDGISGVDYFRKMVENSGEHRQSQRHAEREKLMELLVVAGKAAKDSSSPSADSFKQAWDKHRRSRDDPTEASSTAYLDSEKELDRYLEDDLAPDTEDFDILGWWKAHMSEYPTVALMARDALAMPTCSKLSSQEMAHVKSIVRGYSKKGYKQLK